MPSFGTIKLLYSAKGSLYFCALEAHHARNRISSCRSGYAMPARQPRTHTEEWQHLTQYCLWPEQRRYELVRPIVLFGDLPSDRAAATEASERTLRRQAEQFDTVGMASLFRPTPQQAQDQHRSLPPPIRQGIVDLRADYAA